MNAFTLRFLHSTLRTVIPIPEIPRSIIVDALMYPSQDDRFSWECRVIARLKAAGFIQPKGNVAYNAKEVFSSDGKGLVVSSDVYDSFLISFIDTDVWYLGDILLLWRYARGKIMLMHWVFGSFFGWHWKERCTFFHRMCLYTQPWTHKLPKINEL